MAKLSVVVPANEVEVGGVKYRKVERKAQAGDIVKITDSSWPDCVIEGAFYEVERIDSYGDPQIIDEDGDEWDLAGDDFEVYKKVAESAETKYREVKRWAKIGERIRIVNLRDERYSTGDEFVVSEDALSGDMIITHPKHGRVCVLRNEYVVLEPVESAEPSKPERLTVGDYAKVIANNAEHNYGIGSIVKIITDDRDGTPYRAERADGSDGNWLQEEDVEPATEAEFNAQKPQHPDRLKVGEYAKKVIDEGGDEVGTILKITKNDRVSDLDFIYATEKLDGTSGDIYALEHLVRATESEVEAAKQALERAKANGEFADGGYAVIVDVTKGGLGGFKNGEYVPVECSNTFGQWTHLRVRKGGLTGYCNADALRKVTREEYEGAIAKLTNPRLKIGELARTLVGKDVPEGSIVRITRDDRSRLPYRGELLDGSEYDWYKPEQLEKISAEQAKWAAIGRKVGEFKAGDVVEATRRLGDKERIYGVFIEGPDSSGAIAIETAAGDYRAVSADTANLVVPVEQRFDLAKGGASPSK